MHIAVYSPDRNERYELSRLVDDILLRQGVLPEISMFPMLPELLAASELNSPPFGLIILSFAGNTSAIKGLCRRTAVIMIGQKSDGPDAFEVGAEYFLESPIDKGELVKAVRRCSHSSRTHFFMRSNDPLKDRLQN